jgi:hypothetical protein
VAEIIAGKIARDDGPDGFEIHRAPIRESGCACERSPSDRGR